jgi:hypothetical protein
METITIDIPARGEVININADQWRTMERWLSEQDISYHRKSPEQSAPATAEQSILTYVIDDKADEVEQYLREI